MMEQVITLIMGMCVSAFCNFHVVSMQPLTIDVLVAQVTHVEFPYRQQLWPSGVYRVTPSEGDMDYRPLPSCSANIHAPKCLPWWGRR